MAVQVNPSRPKLKPPGTIRLKLEYDELLSSCAFKFNLPRYILALRRATYAALGRAVQVDRIKPTLKAPGTKRVETII
jgi:hypothetical protein